MEYRLYRTASGGRAQEWIGGGTSSDIFKVAPSLRAAVRGDLKSSGSSCEVFGPDYDPVRSGDHFSVYHMTGVVRDGDGAVVKTYYIVLESDL